MKDYKVTLNYINENKEVKIRAPNIRYLKYVLDKMFLSDNKLVHVHFSTCKGYYAKAHHQDWFYSRSN